MQSVSNDIEQDARDTVSSATPAREANVYGITDSAKKIKDELAGDPYNLLLILRLGLAYSRDGAWLKCGNVLHRGWPRVGELEDRVARATFGVTLAEALLRQSQPSQSLEVLEKVDEPAEKGARRTYFSLRCQARCGLGEPQLALRELCRAIEGQTFQDVLTVWASTRTGMQKVGVFDGAKNAVARAATSEEDRLRLDTLENLADAESDQPGKPSDGGRQVSGLRQRLRISAMLLGSRLGALPRGAVAVAGACCRGKRR